MSGNGLQQLSNQIDMLSYTERLFLLDKIVKSLQAPEKTPAKKNSDFESAFGLWSNREISLSEIRQKAWSRS